MGEGEGEAAVVEGEAAVVEAQREVGAIDIISSFLGLTNLFLK